MVRLWRSFKALINVKKAAGFISLVVASCLVLSILWWLFSALLQIYANTVDEKLKLDVLAQIISGAGLIATVLAAIGFLINYFSSQKNMRLSEERLITDRFAKAVEQIGSDKEEVVIGGIYSLERIAKDSPKDQWTIMEVLAAFVRKNSPISDANSEPVTIDVQTALTVIGRRNPDQDNIQEDKGTKNLKLRDSNLKEADLYRANLKGANLYRANLRRAYLENATLESSNLIMANLVEAYLIGSNLGDADIREANLASAKLEDANLAGANLGHTNLTDVNLKGTNLAGANLAGANLAYANLAGANLAGANLADANLSNEQIKAACFWEKAIYTGYSWNEKEKKMVANDEQADQQKIEEIRQEQASDPKNPPDCSKWEPKN